MHIRIVPYPNLKPNNSICLCEVGVRLGEVEVLRFKVSRAARGYPVPRRQDLALFNTAQGRPELPSPIPPAALANRAYALVDT